MSNRHALKMRPRLPKKRTKNEQGVGVFIFPLTKSAAYKLFSARSAGF
jgi:hypothetical protein